MDDRKPLLLISDAPTSGTGLGRICRDLAVRIHENLSDVYRVGVLGWSGSGSRHFGFAQYHVEGMNQWVLPTLPDVWEDFAGKEHGIILGVWDASRFFWFSQPARSEHLNSYPLLRKWLNNAPFKRWLYCPLDASGPNDRLTFPIMQTLLGFDRILAYGPFGESVIRKTIGEEESSKRNLTNLPHGIDGTVFCERDRVLSRKLFLQITGAQSLTGNTLPVAEDELLLGIISTNQARKDFGLVLEACSILSRDRKIRLWIHTDVLERCWSIPSLLIDYGLIDRTIISLNRLPDENLSYALSACDLTIGPGAEGFGLPLLESQYCGTPVVTGSYAGGADIVPKEWQVDPDAFRYEGEYACKRPVYTAWRWASTVNSLIGKRCDRPDEYDWNNLWPRWKKWLLDGIEEKKIVSQTGSPILSQRTSANLQYEYN
jgi:glycosyltransferase involved in cell wall biosynthesis